MSRELNRHRVRHFVRPLLALVATALVAGCGVGLEDLPAPSGTHGPTYKVTGLFRDVQNLTLGAKIKLGGVVIGEVESISTHDYVAAVRMRLEKQFKLGRDARFQIRFTTPLGEDFIAIVSAGAPRAGVLVEGDTIPLRDTSDAPSIEDTFAAVSTLLNGGGLNKLHIIATELNDAFKGRSGNARNALINLHKLVVNLDEHKLDIDRTLDGMAGLASTLSDGTGVVQEALDLFPSTLQTLADDTQGIRELLDRVSDLGGIVSGMLQRSQHALVTDLDNLRPTLDSLRAQQSKLVPTFRSLIPLGKSVQRAAPGDYLNISATIQFLLNAPPARPRPGGFVHPGAEPNDAVSQLLTGGGR
jgi:phospholipid/cholesterol/gamma-HCH transport system substrate-binding protein